MNTFRNFYKLTSWVLPTKHLKLRYKDFCTSLDLRKDLIITQENYKNVLARLKNKKDKIRVIFLIRENQKWTYQSVYEKFDKSEKFEPLILVSLLELVAKGKDKTRNNLEENYNFFKSKGMNVDYAYKNGQYIDLKKFEPDIVFYDQPWELPNMHKPQQVSEYALTCYCSYSYEIIDNREHYLFEFHRFLYRFFVDDNSNLLRYEKYLRGNSKNCYVVGYPKLDKYNECKDVRSPWKNQNAVKIIYAPHHSLDNNGLRLSTFKQNGKFILELAKSHPETEWILKPHPRLKYALLKNNLMTKDEIDEYFNEWEKIGAVYNKGDYIDLFKTSDLMITDCGSFLAEYLPSKHPIIHLKNKKSVNMNKLGKKIDNEYYQVNNCSELEEVFDLLVLKKNDYKKETRIDLINQMFSKESVSKKIYNHIINLLGGEYEKLHT